MAHAITKLMRNHVAKLAASNAERRRWMAEALPTDEQEILREGADISVGDLRASPAFIRGYGVGYMAGVIEAGMNFCDYLDKVDAVVAPGESEDLAPCGTMGRECQEARRGQDGLFYPAEG